MRPLAPSSPGCAQQVTPDCPVSLEAGELVLVPLSPDHPSRYLLISLGLGGEMHKTENMERGSREGERRQRRASKGGSQAHLSELCRGQARSVRFGELGHSLGLSYD